MTRALGFAIFLVGFAMLFAGIALLLGGDIEFKSGKKISKRVGRKTALALLAFFPLVFVAHFILRYLDRDRIVPSAAIYGPLALSCLGVGLVWLRRGMTPAKPVRSFTIDPTIDFDAGAASSTGPVVLQMDDASPSAPSPAPKPARAKKVPNPFDFS